MPKLSSNLNTRNGCSHQQALAGDSKSTVAASRKFGPPHKQIDLPHVQQICKNQALGHYPAMCEYYTCCYGCMKCL